jgi:phospholipase C
MQRRDFLKYSTATAAMAAAKLGLPSSAAAQQSPLRKIDHVVVLMLENRSFDSMLGALGKYYTADAGFDGLSGNESNLDVNNNPIAVYNDPTDYAFLIPDPDPGETFLDINEQLFDIHGRVPPGAVPTMGGFVKNYMRQTKPAPSDPRHVMHYFKPEQIPVLSRLALEFAVCDRWFASAPCQTWPNRLFLHTGTPKDTAEPDAHGYEDNFVSKIVGGFASPTVFKQLENANNGSSWKIYFRYGSVPHSSILTELQYLIELVQIGGTNTFASLARFMSDCEYGKLPSYSFVEPLYRDFNVSLSKPDDQHPVGDITPGEKLIADVYNSVRRGKNWNSTLLIITYDEHGGLFDHVPPPAAVPPDDVVTDPFNFDRYGVRVPAVIVSPYIKPRTVLRAAPGGYPFDHTSIIATLRKRFSIGAPLSNRIAVAPDLEPVLNLDQPSNQGPEILTPGDASWFTR